jgi:hypothetical protein
LTGPHAPSRAAIYWAPGLHDPLWELGCAWLGRDAATGAPVPQPHAGRIGGLTETARHYGFHCTLLPPIHPAGGVGALCAAARRAARAVRPFALPPLEVHDIGGFLALGLAGECAPVRALADLCFIETEALRPALSAAELERRRAAGLSPRQDAILLRWGYPYAMEEWFFHLTLTCRLDASERMAIWQLAERHFAAALGLPRVVEDICVFAQDGGDFRIVERIPLG